MNVINRKFFPGGFDLIGECEARNNGEILRIFGIPQDYTHLYFISQMRSVTSSVATIRFGYGGIDYGANYYYNSKTMGNAGMVSADGVAQTEMYIARGGSANSTDDAGVFGIRWGYIIGYSLWGSQKGCHFVAGLGIGNASFGTAVLTFGAGIWDNESPIDCLEIREGADAGFMAGSYVEIYGMR